MFISITYYLMALKEFSMIIINTLSLGMVLVLGLQGCGKVRETKYIDNTNVSEENTELKTRVSELEKELEAKLQLGLENEKLTEKLALSTTAKENQEGLLKFAQAQNLLNSKDLLAALERKIVAAENGEVKTTWERLLNFYKSILPEGGDVTLYCTKLIDLAVAEDLLTKEAGRDLKLEGSAPVFVKPGDITSQHVGVAPCDVVYNSLFERD